MFLTILYRPLLYIFVLGVITNFKKLLVRMLEHPTQKIANRRAEHEQRATNDADHGNVRAWRRYRRKERNIH